MTASLAVLAQSTHAAAVTAASPVPVLLTSPVPIFATVMLLLLVVPLFARRIRLPEVVALIIAGILVGENGFGLIAREGAIELLGKVGLLYIVFTAGLEIDLNGFAKQKGRSLAFGSISFGIPLAVGTIVAAQVLDFSMAQAVLLASMFGSHTLLSYPIVSRLGLSQNTAVTTALGGTMVTDGGALLVLAVVAAMGPFELQDGVLTGLSTPDAAFWGRFGGLVAVFALWVALALPRLSRVVFRSLDNDGVMQYVYVLAAVFASAALAELCMLADIIGAFAAGLALNRLIPQRSPLMNRISFVGSALFIPMFLISVGMLVKWRALVPFRPDTDWQQGWLVALVMVSTVLVTKLVAAHLARFMFRYSAAEGWVIYGLSVAQAAATLAAVMVGANIGLFDEHVINGTIVMILATCVVSPMVTEKYGRMVARKQEEEVASNSEAPQRILVPLANPATTERLMNLAVLLHDPKSGQPLYPLTVAMDDENVKERVAQGEKNLSAAVTFAAAAGRPVEPVTRVDVNIGNGIIRALVELRIRTVVIGWNGEVSARDRIFGSVLDRLLEGSQQSVFVYRHVKPTTEHRRVLLAIPPFSSRQPGFSAVISEIRTLTQQLGASLHVVTPRDGKASLKKHFDNAKPAISAQWIELPTWEWLLQDLTRNAMPEDLILVMATRKGSIAWSPDLDKLPRQLAQRFPDNSFAIVYPSLEDTRTIDVNIGSHRVALRRLARSGGEPIQLDVLTAKEANQVIAQHMAGPDGRPEEIAGMLRESARSSSIRIVPGTVLLDGHDMKRTGSHLVVANALEDGLVFETLPEPVDHVWVLISGRDVSAEEHLLLLTCLSQQLRHVPAEMLDQAQTLDGVLAVLNADPI